MIDPLRAAAQALVDWYEGPPYAYVESEMEERIYAIRAALAADTARIEAESRNATLDEVVRVVEGLHQKDTDECYGNCHTWTVAAVLDAVKALRG